MADLQLSTEEEKICQECGALNSADRYKCRNTPCEGRLISQQPDFSHILKDNKPASNLYKVLEDEVPLSTNHISMIAGEPDLLNPNGYENITKILRNLGVRVGIRRYGVGLRQWIILEVDGAIFCIVEQLIFHTLFCPLSKTPFSVKASLIKTHAHLSMM